MLSNWYQIPLFYSLKLQCIIIMTQCLIHTLKAYLPLDMALLLHLVLYKLHFICPSNHFVILYSEFLIQWLSGIYLCLLFFWVCFGILSLSWSLMHVLDVNYVRKYISFTVERIHSPTSALYCSRIISTHKMYVLIHVMSSEFDLLFL